MFKLFLDFKTIVYMLLQLLVFGIKTVKFFGACSEQAGDHSKLSYIHARIQDFLSGGVQPYLKGV
jgi:hypothetical protein